jgi:hypothetical protein
MFGSEMGPKRKKKKTGNSTDDVPRIPLAGIIGRDLLPNETITEE